MPSAVVLNLPEHGHLNATLPLVAELARRGDRVTYYATEPYRSALEATGSTFASYGDVRRFTPPAHEGGLYSVMAWQAQLAEERLPSLLEELRAARPDYLLVDSMCLWGQLAAQILSVPTITLGSVFVPDDRFVTVDEVIDRAYGRAPKEVLLAGIDALNSYLMISQRIDRQHGTSSPDLVGFFAGRQALNVLFTSRDFHPEGPRYDNSYRFVGPSIAPRHGTAPLTLPDGSDPLVYVSMGTIFNDRPPLFRACLEALAGIRCRVLVATGSAIDAQALGTVPANVLVRETVPQLDVLVHASLFITHGGMNSVSEALWFGVPLVVLPQHGDQFLVAGRVAELGAGIALMPPECRADRIRAAAAQMLERPAYAEAARTIGGTFRAAGGVQRAADDIMAFVRATV